MDTIVTKDTLRQVCELLGFDASEVAEVHLQRKEVSVVLRPRREGNRLIQPTVLLYVEN